MAAAVEREVFNSYIFSFVFDKACINPKEIQSWYNFVGRQEEGPVDLGSHIITSSRACHQPCRSIETLSATRNSGDEGMAPKYEKTTDSWKIIQNLLLLSSAVSCARSLSLCYPLHCWLCWRALPAAICNRYAVQTTNPSGLGTSRNGWKTLRP
jgi:hypothetical protein